MLVLSTPKALLKRLRVRTSSTPSLTDTNRPRTRTSFGPSGGSGGGGGRLRRTRSFSAGGTRRRPARSSDEVRARQAAAREAYNRARDFATQSACASTPPPMPTPPPVPVLVSVPVRGRVPRPKLPTRPARPAPKPKFRSQIDLTHYRRNPFGHYDCPVASCLARFLRRDKLSHHVQHEHRRHHAVPLYCSKHRALLRGAAAFNAHYNTHHNPEAKPRCEIVRDI